MCEYCEVFILISQSIVGLGLWQMSESAADGGASLAYLVL